MELVHTVPLSIDIDSELLAIYPDLARRLALVFRDAVDAEDVSQAAFARAFEQRHTFTGGDVRAWFYTIGLRLAFNELRHRRVVRERTTTDEPMWAMASDPDLWLALAELEPNQRAALLLSSLDGYTHPEIGQILGVPAGTVSSWLSRTKQRLRDVLGDEP